MEPDRHAIAQELFERAYRHQMQGELDKAVDLYKDSIRACPTAEAYTFLGWTYRFQGKIDAAIEQCKFAILIDPGFGNPYNDIGAYLIEKYDFDGAIPWLEKATRAPRYEAYHYAWYNLGRAYLGKDMYTMGRQCLEKSLEIEPRYDLARNALSLLKKTIQ